MNRIIRYAESCVAVILSAAAIFLYGCNDQMDIAEVDTCSEYITFVPTVNAVDSKVTTRSIGNVSSYISSEEEEWLYAETKSDTALITRGSPVTSVSEAVGLYGYKLSSGETEPSPENKSWDKMTNRKFVLSGDELTTESDPILWSSVDSEESLKVYAYSPYYDVQDLSQLAGIPKLEYEVGTSVDKQSDIIVADALVPPLPAGRASSRENVALDFKHIMTAVRFKTDFACTVVSIKLTNIRNKGTYTFGQGWNLSDGSTDYEISFGEDGKQFKKGDMLTSGEKTMMLLPQVLADDAEVEVKIKYEEDGENKEKTIKASLKGKVWREGKIITYTLHDKTKHNFVYLDLAAGNVVINKTKVEGYYYKTEYVTEGESIKTETDKVEIDQDRTDTDVYYVYQSTSKNRSKTGLVDGKWELPVYPAVMGPDNDGKTWSEYITNNINVQDVIEKWDNPKGAGQATENKVDDVNPNNEGSDGVVRKAGREATKNRIHISDNVGQVNLFIDNIYSSYQQRDAAGSDGAVRTRNKGGISFLPSETAGNSTLTINIIGDNRLGCVNYQNNDSTRNCLVFEGTGSLTVADTDYYWMNTGVGKGNGSNRSCSVIGGKDSPEDKDDVYNIVFNSGIIYVGAITSSCTAIGGGGNGNTKITINGGTITAVAKTTGTAIGGGTGLLYAGGIGNITINNGNVYAYNYRNGSNVPSSAIGGAGSRDKDGSLGTVNIHGGYVYAYSQYGTAIGGGSSQKTKGGNAKVYITGGTVIAKSDDGTGIGGGSACTGGSNTADHNGGTAAVTISGNPIIRTGSVGGGITGAKKGKLGSADIKIYGGDIQAQFIMAAGSDTAPKFVMDEPGGTIRNSNVGDAEYKHMRNYGGAVYLEDGTFEMKAGKIMDCQAEKGGAVYIVGESTTTFTMTGGTIENCIAKSDGGLADGGAVYLEGGTVTVGGSALIRKNIANGGHGGGVCLKQGDFTMSGEAKIEFNNSLYREDNSAKYGGNGGGVYVSSDNVVNVTIESGSITDNTASRKGGGVCVDMPSSSSTAQANIIIGKDDSELSEMPYIQRNICLYSGAGLYASGAKSNIAIYDGNINDNNTSTYVHNEDVANEEGMVTLHSGDVPHIEVIFDGNGGTLNNDGVTTQVIQKIVTATNSLLVIPPTDGDGAFRKESRKVLYWKTTRDETDGVGETYRGGEIINRKNNLKLYAIYEK